MIFCEKLLFLHVPKAAGSSLAQVLLDRLPRPTYYSHPDSSLADPDNGIVHVPGGSHENLAEAKEIVAEYGFDLEKIPVILGVVRNPYAMEVSRYAYLRTANPYDIGYNQALALTSDFETFAVKSKPHGWLKRPIESYFTLDGEIPPNMHILRLEHLLEDLNPALEAAGLPRVENLPRANTSEHADFRGYYTVRSEQAVFERYRWLFDQGFYDRLDRGELSNGDAVRTQSNGGVATKDVSPAELAAPLIVLAHGADADTRARIVGALLADLDEAGQAEVFAALALSPALVAAIGYHSEDADKATAAETLLREADDEAKKQVACTLVRALPDSAKSGFIAELAGSDPAARDFGEWERHGLHLTPNYFYSPIPSLADIGEDPWARDSRLEGIDLNIDEQLRLLRDVFPDFAAECADFAAERSEQPGAFFFSNGRFDGTDAAICYCLIRFLRPNRIIEIGSGYSTRLMSEALERNGRGSITCIDPYPDDVVAQLTIPRLAEIVPQRVERVDVSDLVALGANDVLFIDSSHVSKIDGDVNFLFLEVLPLLKPGVVVHVHDVFLPEEYPRAWIFEHHHFWNEQYLLHAFLAFNQEFEVVMANNFLGKHYHQLLQETFPMAPWWGGGSFWLRRTSTSNDPARRRL